MGLLAWHTVLRPRIRVADGHGALARDGRTPRRALVRRGDRGDRRGRGASPGSARADSTPAEPDRAAVDAFLVDAHRRAWGRRWQLAPPPSLPGRGRGTNPRM